MKVDAHVSVNPHGEAGAPASGARALVDFLAERGDRHVFGVTGSSMVSVFHELASSPLTFVPAIHESAAIAAADGYARVTGSACVLLYMVQGVANGLANLYNAWCDETPLTIIASQPPSWAQTGLGAILGEGDVVGVARPVTRFAARVPEGSSMLGWLQRAHRIAGGPPSGPVLLSVPEDVLTGPALAPGDQRNGRRVAAGAPDLAAIAEAMRTASHPLIVVGGQVTRSGGAASLRALAEELHAPVAWEQGFNDRHPMPAGHPLAVGALSSTVGRSLELESDVVLAIGCRLLLEVHPRDTPHFPGAHLVAHVNADVAKLEGLTNADWACACDPTAVLDGLLEVLRGTPVDANLLDQRRTNLEQRRQNHRVPPNPLVSVLENTLKTGWLVDESVSLYPTIERSLVGGDGSRHLSMSGGSLGWGAGAACGVALGSGDPVTCVLGDGALRFGAQALWTARACNLPVTYVVLDNGGFGSTRSFEREYVSKSKPDKAIPGYVGSDLRDLGPDIERLIEGYGIPCTRVVSPEKFAAALDAAQGCPGPTGIVVDVGYQAGGWGDPR